MKSILSLWPYLRPHRRRLALGLVLVVGASAGPAVVPWFVRGAIDANVSGAPLRTIYGLVALMVATSLIASGFLYGMREILNGVSRHVEYDLRNALFAHLEGLDATYFARARTGDIMARLTNDLSAVRMAAGPAIMYLVNTIARGAFVLAFMLHYSVMLTAIAVLPAALLPVIMIRLGRLIHDRFESVQEHFGTITSHAQENLSGTRIVRAYRQEGSELGRFAALNEEYLARNMRLAYLNGATIPAFALLAGLAAVIVLGIGGSLVIRGAITVGTFVAFVLWLPVLTWPLVALGWVVNLFQRGAASMGRLNEILNTATSITGSPHPRALPPLLGDRRGRSIEFRGVGFHYPVPAGQTPRWVLRDISFTVPVGATLGVAGATGAGKSALIDLIPRLYDPQEGEILIDGIPIREIGLADLRRELGPVPQESLVFSDTIGANLVYGLPESGSEPSTAAADGAARGATADAVWAAHVAQLDDTIASFPGGFDTMLGERGINLSGGQKQRTALARALARRPAVVLLDDSLSAIDTHTEAEILRGLRQALTGRTAVIASHRISALRDATWIIVLDEGRLVEQGRHDDLLALSGRYWSLVRRQQLVDAIERDAA